MKAAIKKWLDKEYSDHPNLSSKETGLEQEFLLNMIGRCMADIGPKWVSVDIPPKVEGGILIEVDGHQGKYQIEGFHDGHDGDYYDWDGDLLEHATHWRELDRPAQ